VVKNPGTLSYPALTACRQSRTICTASCGAKKQDQGEGNRYKGFPECQEVAPERFPELQQSTFARRL
jgi:hypothetical protein